MTNRVRERDMLKTIRTKGFLGGLGSIVSIDPALSFASYKDQSHDMKMLTRDLQRVGSDFRIAIGKVTSESKKR